MFLQALDNIWMARFPFRAETLVTMNLQRSWISVGDPSSPFRPESNLAMMPPRGFSVSKSLERDRRRRPVDPGLCLSADSRIVADLTESS